MRFLGVALLWWSIVCAGIAIVYYFVYPERATTADSQGVRFVLRYGHALTWLLLFIACLLPLVTQSRRLVNVVAWLGLGVYILFMATFLMTRNN